MSYLSSLVSSVGNVISTTATAAANAYSGTSHKEIATFLAGFRLLSRVEIPGSSPLAPIYVLFDAIYKVDNTPVTIFIHNDPAYPNPSAPPPGTPAAGLYSQMARQALRRLRMLRHPDLLAYRAGVGAIDSGPIYFATERVRPVGRPLNLLASEEGENLSKNQRAQLIAWGLHKTGSALRFLNTDCSLIHGMVTLDCIFVNMGLEWKLGGFELLSGITEEDFGVFRTNIAQVKSIKNYLPSSPDNISLGLDAWMFGALIYEIFTNEIFDISSALPPLSVIPASLHATYKRLLQKDERHRLKDTGKILSSAYFNTALIETNDFLTQLAVKESEEKEKFFKSVLEQAAEFPSPFILHRLLPQLCTSVEFGAGGVGALGAIMRLADGVPNEEFASVVVAPLLRAFKSPDRQMRMNLLTHLPQLATYLTPENVTEELYPSLVTGFQDAAPQLKEATVRGVLCVVDKLKPRIINQDLFGHLQSLQFDAHPAVRTNTLIGMGRIVLHLDSSERESKLIPSLLRSLRDPFPPARRATLHALGATVQHVDVKVLCNLVLPSSTPLLIDPEKVVRDAAVVTIESALIKIKAAANSMPDSPAKPPTKEVKGAPTESDSGWTGWAVSSISKSIVSAADTISSRTADVVSPKNPHDDVPPTNAVHQAENISLSSLRQAALDDKDDDAEEEGGWGEWKEEPSKKKTSKPLKLNSPVTLKLKSDDGEDGWGDWAEESPKKGSPKPQKVKPPAVFKDQSEDGEDGWGEWKEDDSFEAETPKPQKLKSPIAPKTNLSSPPVSNSVTSSPAKKREEYRRQLEERRKNKPTKPPSSQDSKSARGMALGPKRTNVD